MSILEDLKESSTRSFPWWIVWVWSGVLVGVFYWLWKQRSLGSKIQPIQIDLSFLRPPSAAIPEPTPPEEVLVAGPAPVAAPAEKAAEAISNAQAQPDDLTVIHGIGPKIAQILRRAGIDTFKRLAQTGPETLREILQSANIRLADPESWPAQAHLAAQGQWVEGKGSLPRPRAGRKS
jgi:predicted flap endonuclease-1-like 5' DNA nuclease